MLNIQLGIELIILFKYSSGPNRSLKLPSKKKEWGNLIGLSQIIVLPLVGGIHSA